MRNTKKAISILLTLLMVVGMMSTFAFAATTTGSITIENPQKNENYTVYKILSATTDSTQSKYSYTIDSNDYWFKAVKNAADINKNKFFNVEQVGTSSTYYVTPTDKLDVAALAKHLKKYLKDNATNAPAGLALDASNSYVLSNLDYGYYFVNTGIGTFANLNTVVKAVTIRDKNSDSPFEKTVTKIAGKVVDGSGKVVSADIGDVISYQLETEVASIKGYDELKFVMTDKLTSGLTFNNDIKYVVSHDGTEINLTTIEGAVTINDAGSATFKITIDMSKLQSYIGDKIYVRYSATLNESAVDVNNNGATLQYPNPDGTPVPKTSDAKVKTALVKIDKYDSNNEETKLAGAKFVLKNKEGKYYVALDADGNKITNITKDSAIKNVDWVDSKSDASEVVTSATGEAYFKGLAAGKYYLEETVAPDGYNPLREPQEITVVTGESNDSVTVGYTAPVPNSTGTELPSTGGIGTTIFYLIGAILVIGAGVVFVTRRRMHSDK